MPLETDTYYDILGIDQETTLGNIHEQFSILSKGKTSDELKLYEEARDTLIDPKKRAMYDKAINRDPEFINSLTAQIYQTVYNNIRDDLNGTLGDQNVPLKIVGEINKLMPQGAKFTAEEQEQLVDSMASGKTALTRENEDLINHGFNDIFAEAPQVAKTPQDFQNYEQTKRHFKDANLTGVGKSAKEMAKTAAAMTVRFIGGFVAAGMAITGAAVRAAGEIISVLPVAGAVARHLPGSTYQGGSNYRRNCFKNLGDALMSASLYLAQEIGHKQAPAVQLAVNLTKEMKQIRNNSNIEKESEWLEYQAPSSFDSSFSYSPLNQPGFSYSSTPFVLSPSSLEEHYMHYSLRNNNYGTRDMRAVSIGNTTSTIDLTDDSRSERSNSETEFMPLLDEKITSGLRSTRFASDERERIPFVNTGERKTGEGKTNKSTKNLQRR